MPKKQPDPVVLIEQALARQDYILGSSLLIEHSRDLLQPGRLPELRAILAKIPKDQFYNHPKLILLAANADYQSGELKSALRCLTAAVPVLEKARDRSSLSAAYRYISYIHQDMGQNKKAIQACRQGLKYLDKADYRGRAGLLSAMAGSHWRLLDHRKAFRTYAQVMNIYIRAGDKEGQIRTLANASAITKARGELERARKEKEEVLRFYQDSENRRSYCLAAVNLSAVYLEIFELEKAELLLTSVIPEIQKLGLGMALGPARVYLGELQTNQGRFAEAEKTLKFALANTDISDEASYHFSCLSALSSLYRFQGDLTLAKKCAAEALEKTSPERPLDSTHACLSISRVCLALGDTGQAVRYGAKAVKAYEQRGMEHRLFLALLNLAEIYPGPKKMTAFVPSFSRALRISQKRGYDFVFSRQNPENYRHLIPAYTNKRNSLKYLKKLQEKYPPDGGVNNGPIAHHRLRIVTLGSLTAALDGKTIEQWKRTASRQVLGVLLSRHVSPGADSQNCPDRFIQAEVLSLMLWPQKSLAAAAINLQVAVAELRRLFEPGLKDGKASKYIEFSEGRYRIEVKNLALDFAEFARVVRKGQQAEITGQPAAAQEFYRQAVDLYGRGFPSGIQTG